MLLVCEQALLACFSLDQHRAVEARINVCNINASVRYVMSTRGTRYLDAVGHYAIRRGRSCENSEARLVEGCCARHRSGGGWSTYKTNSNEFNMTMVE